MQDIVIHCKYDKLVPIETFVPHEKNANKHPENQIDLLAKLIRFQGVRHPIIISNLSGKCVAGHGRLFALKKLGFQNIPVVYQDFEDVHQELAFLVSDNKIAELAETDEKMLDEIAISLPEFFDLDLLAVKDLVVEQLDVGFNPDFEAEKEHKKCPHCGEFL